MKRPAGLFLLALAACSSGDEMPSDLLPRDTFTHVLTQAQLVEARLKTEPMVDTAMARASERYYAEMFDREKVTRDAFARTFDWYAAHPEQLKAIYEEVLVRLQQQADSTAH